MQNNDLNKSTKLHDLKSIYEKIQFSLTYRTSLFEKRETLHHHIELLKNKLSQEKIDCHIAHRSQLPTVKSLEESVGKHQLLLDESIRELRDLDSRIDDIEDYSAEQIMDLQQSVVTDLISLFPEQKEHYSRIDEDLKSLITTHKEWNYLNQITLQLELILTALLEERKSVRGFGLIKYVFGMNPNIIITKHLRSIDRLVNNELKLIESISEHESDQKLYQKLKNDLMNIMEELKALSPKRWSFHLIDHSYASYLDKVQALRSSIEEFGIGLDTFILQSEARKRSWIEEMLRTP